MAFVHNDTISIKKTVFLLLLLSVFIRISEDLALVVDWKDLFGQKIEMYDMGVEEKSERTKSAKVLEEFWLTNPFFTSVLFFKESTSLQKTMPERFIASSFYPTVPTPPPDVC